MSGMGRREFVALLGGVAVTWPLAVRAQQSAMPVIGMLGSATPDWYADRLRAFREGLGETGYVEGRNVTIDYRWAEGRNDRLPPLAAELVQQQVALIVLPQGPLASPRLKPVRVRFEGGASMIPLHWFVCSLIYGTFPESTR
jgi:putative tryptophan/tyrosine transport system substrate-binding protein